MWLSVLIIQILHVVYHQATTIFDLYPFNNIRAYSKRDQLFECAVNALFMGFPVVAMVLHNNVLIWIAVWCYVFTLIAEYFAWWRGYFWGPTIRWKEGYDKKFKETFIILPAIKDHPIPNLEHTILHSLTLLSAIFTFFYAYQNCTMSRLLHVVIAGVFLLLIGLMIRWCVSFDDNK